MFIFNTLRQEKGLCAIVASRPLWLATTTLGLASSLSLAGTLTPTSIIFYNNESQVQSGGGVFNSNVSLNSVTLGEKTFYLNGADFHSPIAVKLFAQSTKDIQKFNPIDDSMIGVANSPFQFACSPDVEMIPGMTSLDMARSSDCGRMLACTGTLATRTQMFLSLPERDNNALAYDTTPELIVMGSIPNGAIHITPILAGTPEIQESLIFGPTLEIDPFTFASGKTAISMLSHDSATPKRMCVLGLDLSGDLKVPSDRMVIGYQLECPAGANSPMKLMAVGTQESNVYASDTPNVENMKSNPNFRTEGQSQQIFAQASFTSEQSAPATVASVFGADPEAMPENSLVTTQIIGPIFTFSQAGGNDPLPEPGYNAPSVNTSPYQNLDGNGGFPSTSVPPVVVDDPTVVPVPGALTILGCAVAFAGRRRNTRTRS